MASPSNITPGMDMSRTRAEVKESLRRLLTSIETQERQVDSAIQQLADIPKSDLPDFLSAQRDLFMAQQQEQLQEWGALLGNTEMGGANPKNDEEGTPFGVRLRSLESRVAAMGGIPALGAGLVLPRMTPDGRPQLSVTASPAALEVARSRASQGGIPTPLRHVESAEKSDGDRPSSYMPTLRSVPRPEERRGLQSASLQADFAAAMARRRVATQGENDRSGP